MTENGQSIIEAVRPLLRDDLVPALIDNELLILDTGANKVVRVACADASLDDIAAALDAHGMLTDAAAPHSRLPYDIGSSAISRRRMLQGTSAAGVVGVTVLALPNAAMASSDVGIAAPDNVSATVGEESVTVSWDSVVDATSYQVLVKDTAADDSTYTPFGGTVTASPVIVTGLTAGTSYSFVVVASDGISLSPRSAPATATPTELSPGGLDSSFVAVVNNTVNAMVLQADGKIVIGGNFTSVNEVARDRIARLNADGTLDTTFNPPSLPGLVRALALQSDGKVLVGGGFNNVGGDSTRQRFTRLNADGTLDAEFPALIFSSTVFAIAVQSDGRIVVGGQFGQFSGVARNRLARLSSVGVVDTTFPEADGNVLGLAVQSNDQILVVGIFENIASTARNRVARLNADGTLDTFNPNADSEVRAVTVQSNGQILLGGRFTNIAGTNQSVLARLNANGTIDAGFNPSITAGASNVVFYWASVQSDDKILIGGFFTTVGGEERRGVARLNADGTLDPTFDASIGGSVSAAAWSVFQSTSDKVIIAGDFLTVRDVSTPYLARLKA